ncbi:hypothetical protein XH99_31890 [Bradyrhizobium nanningense]|uniref:Glycosyl transferase n=1 Tax=Bradyrhizobium nanningense TaxID=1325118 RepID=A0A4Q0RXX8_9BRAD|nr:hypothetical protein XH99_31890 [Bradyrhizobium nanningense]RXH27584.1 hypothetical protein XH84_29745 [Bradyrhizobium nanningense]TQF28838.1 hypothetical protein UNPA324_03615 [Bradyrhizobium sp. UNPA324]
MDVVVYTDKPARYADLPIRLVDISGEISEFSRGGLYHHRIKPCVLLKEMTTSSNYCVMADTDTFFREGFFERLLPALSSGAVAVDRRHGRNPMPQLAGFTTDLPNVGPYRYDPNLAVEYNSGLTAVDPERHLPVVQDAIAWIDAVLFHGARQLTIEQIALSECLRVHAIPIATMHPAFGHYYRIAHKRYMQWQLQRWKEKNGRRFQPQPGTIPYTRLHVRGFRIFAKVSAVLGRKVETQTRWR